MGTSNLEKSFSKIEKNTFCVPTFSRQKKVKINKTNEKSQILHHQLKQTEEYHQLGPFGEGRKIKIKIRNFFLSKLGFR